MLDEKTTGSARLIFFYSWSTTVYSSLFLHTHTHTHSLSLKSLLAMFHIDQEGRQEKEEERERERKSTYTKLSSCLCAFVDHLVGDTYDRSLLSTFARSICYLLFPLPHNELSVDCLIQFTLYPSVCQLYLAIGSG